jgi:RNA polymerase sigma-70 factor (ECF subfamily)
MYNNHVSNDEFANFCQAVRLLPIQCRKVFVLKKVYGFSQKEIAKQLTLSESTVEKHIALGIKRCTLFMRKNIMSTPKTQHPTKQKGGCNE